MTASPSSLDPKVSFVDVTPELAKSWLQQNTDNRNLNESHVRKLSDALLNGRFQCNGDTIRIAKNGILLDGQHRLHAIARSGVSVRMIIVFDLEPEVASTIDQGKPRSVSDILKIRGLNYAETNLIVSTAGIIIIHSKELQIINNGDRELLANYIQTNASELEQWVRWGHATSRFSPVVSTFTRIRSRGISASAVAALGMHMTRAGAPADSVRYFLEGAAKGFSLSANELASLTPERIGVLQALHKRMISGQPLSKLTGGKSSGMLMTEYAVYITAYDKFVRNQHVKQVKSLKDIPRFFSDLPPVNVDQFADV